MEQNIKEKVEHISNIIKTCGIVDVEIATEPKMNKKGNAYLGRVKKHTGYIGVKFGANYAEEVRKRLAEEGKKAEFTAKPSPYKYFNEYFDCIGSQLYLRMILEKDADIKPIYEVDNRPATKEEIEVIKSFMPAKKSSAEHQGLTLENEVKMRRVKIENVVGIGNAEHYYSVRSE